MRGIAESIKAGERTRIPMGLLFVGPMGTGKTFVAGAFVRESGLSAVKLKNFRSKWVGSTEANLEKVLSLVRSLGPIITSDCAPCVASYGSSGVPPAEWVQEITGVGLEPIRQSETQPDRQREQCNQDMLERAPHIRLHRYLSGLGRQGTRDVGNATGPGPQGPYLGR